MKRILSAIAICLFSAQAYPQIEKLQVAFIFQFTKLIEWCPEGKEGDFQIVLLGNDSELEKELNALNGRMVGSQKLVVSTTNSISNLAGYEIIVLSKAEASNAAQVLNAVGSRCALVISTKAGGAAAGVGISFVESGGKLQFEINRAYMQNHSLKVNDQLYKLAKTVY